MPITDYKEFQAPFAANDISHRVFYRGSGPAVLLMHEINGMTPACVALGDALVKEQFTVYLPLLFGKPGKEIDGINLGLTIGGICISREFKCFAEQETSPITDWLRALGREIHQRTGGKGIGAVGMCVTGGFVLSMMLDAEMIAPVMCQPALPFKPPISLDDSWKASLGVTPTELTDAKKRHAEGLPLVGVRYQTDQICPQARWDRLKREFPNMRKFELKATTKKHASLTGDFSQEAFDGVLAFLKERLQ